MIKTIILFIFSFIYCVFAQAQETKVATPTETSTTTVTVPEVDQPKSYLLKTSFLTSVSGQQIDYRNLKGTTGDESGQTSENSTIPNLNYFSGIAAFRISQPLTTSFAIIQSANSLAARTITTPMGKPFVVPGEILAARVKYKLDSGYYFGASQIYTDVFYMGDPGLNLGHEQMPLDGWGHRYSLRLSVPVTLSSYLDHQITKAFIKASFLNVKGRWASNFAVGLAKTFYSIQPSADGSSGAGGGHHSKSAQAPGASPTPTPDNSDSDPAATGPGPQPFNPSSIDLILADRQDMRATTSAGVSYGMTDNLKFGSSGSLSLVQTLGSHQIWFTNIKPITLNYQIAKSWEVGTDFTFYSDIQDYQAPSLPKLWMAGFHASYALGNSSLVDR